MQQFTKYESIPNENNARTIQYFRENGLTDGQWYATEKVHGTNFSFMSDGNTVVCCQRSGPVEGNFMNHIEYAADIEGKVLTLAKEVGKPIQVFCEYYGDGIINKGAIKYRNDNKKGFVAFDMMIEDQFVSFPKNFEYLHDVAGIPTVFIINVGTFDELLQLNTDFKSYLAKVNGVDSYAEGIVLKPFEYKETESGERVILKRVAERFAENRPKKVEKVSTVTDNNIVELIDSKNTDIRCSKIAAKIGVIKEDKSKFGQLIIELANDIVTDCMTDDNVVVDVNVVKKQITSTVKNFFV